MMAVVKQVCDLMFFCCNTSSAFGSISQLLLAIKCKKTKKKQTKKLSPCWGFSQCNMNIFIRSMLKSNQSINKSKLKSQDIYQQFSATAIGFGLCTSSKNSHNANKWEQTLWPRDSFLRVGWHKQSHCQSEHMVTDHDLADTNLCWLTLYINVELPAYR